jgi:hypothetical protein
MTQEQPPVIEGKWQPANQNPDNELSAHEKGSAPDRADDDIQDHHSWIQPLNRARHRNCR